jgi:oligopeptide transport system substrate-binding protein
LDSLKLNTEVEPFNSKNIRKAPSLAINRDEIIKNAFQREEIAALSAIPYWLFPENRNRYFKDNDVENAKEYLQLGLEEFGYKDVSQLPVITMSISTNEDDKRITESIQEMWKENLGITVTIVSSD